MAARVFDGVKDSTEEEVQTAGWML